MTQTTQTTQTTQQAGEATQETTSQPAETTQQATTPQPEQTEQQTSQQPTANSQEPAKSAFISDGKLPQSKPQPQQAEATSKPADTTEELKAQVTALQARLDAIESQRTTERRTAEVERIIAPLSETLKAVYRRPPFATLTDEEYTQLTETIKKEVNELATADKARGAVFSRPTASKPTDGKASDKETDEVLRRLNL
jgi:hypothetical protein